MFHDRVSNNKINKICERALRTMQKDSTSNFKDLLSICSQEKPTAARDRNL